MGASSHHRFMRFIIFTAFFNPIKFFVCLSGVLQTPTQHRIESFACELRAVHGCVAEWFVNVFLKSFGYYVKKQCVCRIKTKKTNTVKHLKINEKINLPDAGK